jgi:hypothetical protein
MSRLAAQIQLQSRGPMRHFGEPICIWNIPNGKWLSWNKLVFLQRLVSVASPHQLQKWPGSQSHRCLPPKFGADLWNVYPRSYAHSVSGKIHWETFAGVLHLSSIHTSKCHTPHTHWELPHPAIFEGTVLQHHAKEKSLWLQQTIKNT